MKSAFFLLLLCYSNCLFAQINVENIYPTSLPKSLKYEGQIKNTVKWNDNVGLNYVFSTLTGEYISKDKSGEELKNAVLYVYHYTIKADTTNLLWRVYDFEKDCPFDIFVNYLDSSIKVTDLNKNGIAEVWVLYEKQCSSDVSPSTTKILMFEGNKKYALRGESKVKIADNKFLGGTFILDGNFKNSNVLFKQFAINLWNKVVLKK